MELPRRGMRLQLFGFSLPMGKSVSASVAFKGTCGYFALTCFSQAANNTQQHIDFLQFRWEALICASQGAARWFR